MPADVPWVGIDPAWVTMSRLRIGLVWAPIVIAAALVPLAFTAPGWVLIGCVIVTLGAAGWHVGARRRLWRTWGYAEASDELLVRHGLWLRRIVVVPYGRMQSVDLIQGPLERRFGLAQVRLVTASMGATARIEGLRMEVARGLTDRLTARARERQWSL